MSLGDRKFSNSFFTSTSSFLRSALYNKNLWSLIERSFKLTCTNRTRSGSIPAKTLSGRPSCKTTASNFLSCAERSQRVEAAVPFCGFRRLWGSGFDVKYVVTTTSLPGTSSSLFVSKAPTLFLCSLHLPLPQRPSSQRPNLQDGQRLHVGPNRLLAQTSCCESKVKGVLASCKHAALAKKRIRTPSDDQCIWYKCCIRCASRKIRWWEFGLLFEIGPRGSFRTEKLYEIQSRNLLGDLRPGILLWEFLLFTEKKLYRAGRKGRRSRADHLVPRSRWVARTRPRIGTMHEWIDGLHSRKPPSRRSSIGPIGRTLSVQTDQPAQGSPHWIEDKQLIGQEPWKLRFQEKAKS